MKKTLIALAAVAVSSAAMAQATISGSVTAGFKSTDKVGVKSSGYGVNDAEVRFSFSEDLGGGLKASGSMTIDEITNDGSSPTGDGVILALSGGFGSVSLSNVGGADFLPVDGLTDESETMFAAGDRLTYVSPTFSGVKITVMDSQGDVGEGAKPTASAENNSTIFMLDYAAGPLSATVLQQNFKNKTAASEQSRTGYKVGYNFGVAAVSYAVLDTDHGTAADVKETGVTFSAPLGDRIKASYNMATSKTGTAAALDGNSISLSYALSKRTSISYFTESHDTRGNATKKTKETSLYLNHKF